MSHGHDAGDDDGPPKPHDDHEGGHDEPWLVSYADMMTLLFGFFVLMYSLAVAKIDKDDDKMIKMRKEMAKYFGGEYVTPEKNTLEDFKKAIKGTQLENNINTKLSPEGVEISMQSASLFASGSAKLLPDAEKAIRTLGVLMKKKKESDFDIVIEGHTDDAPLINTTVFPSNWELSSARAGSVVRILAQAGFSESRMRTVGYASGRPAVPNRDKKGVPLESNRAKNRRVVMRFLNKNVTESQVQPTKKPEPASAH